MKRRAFLWTLGSACLGALAGEWWARAPRTLPPLKSVLIPGAMNLAVGSALGFVIPDTAVPGIIVRLRSDSYVAFDRRCTHLGCPVLWSAERGRFECPCHAAVFDAQTGQVLQGPPRRGLQPVALKMSGTEAWLYPHASRSADQDDDGEERGVG